jgi:hypothetical protein
VVAKARWFGKVEARDGRAAIEKAAEKFKTDASRLIGVRRRQYGWYFLTPAEYF